MRCEIEECTDKAVVFVIPRTQQQVVIYRPCGQIIDCDEEDLVGYWTRLCLFHSSPKRYHQSALDALKGV